MPPREKSPVMQEWKKIKIERPDPAILGTGMARDAAGKAKKRNKVLDDVMKYTE